MRIHKRRGRAYFVFFSFWCMVRTAQQVVGITVQMRIHKRR
jgi:hypothetical protein